MGCLYCGKDIGPFRLLRDSEFCSAVHRKSYGERLGRALGQISAPASAPAPIAGFQILFAIQEAKSASLSIGFLPRAHDTRVAGGWPVSVAPPLGQSFRAYDGAAAAPLQAAPHSAGAAPPAMRMPRFELAAMGGIQDIDERPTTSAPPISEAWMPVPAAQPAERFVDFAFADTLATAACPALPQTGLTVLRDEIETPEATPALCDAWMPAPAAQAVERMFALASASNLALPVVLPSIGHLRVARTFVREVSVYAPTPQPQPVTAGVWPSMDSRPAAYNRPTSQLRFSLHAIDEVASVPVAAPVPDLAGPRPGLQPMPVETMPSVHALEISALPIAPAVSLPSIRCMTAQVLPQARALPRPAASPVERFPEAGAIRIQSVPMRPALRFPTLAHFRPAADSGEPLAAPVTAPGPAPVEAMPSFAAFQAVPLPAAPSLMVRAFHPEIRAEFSVPSVPLAAPQPAAPLAAYPKTAAPDPLARIEAQPAGAQPERPKPAIPQPGIIALEYYSQRIASAPVKRIEAIATRVAIVQAPFALEPVRFRFEDLQKKRVVLPFEEIFRKKGAKRSSITLTGKIAATLMVGIALWTGSRVANLSQHTEALRAQVAASERTVTAAEVREANYGNGPMGKFRRAIADRAATEITDNFHSGMAAWGAEPKTAAAGWKRHPEGYVSVGDMALFQPSLKYTDYHMEFYGQIEDKSMSWAVRAQDKKNYYAMKFKVIESGLRPIIAMVHYGVVNGKPGRKSETPLNVMVHNNQPYHVAVDVQGNRFTASIEGEPVETWTDDAAPQGGVGFFAEAGEKARLYWMRLSRNQDWLGRVCAYMSGDGRSRQQTAELWGPEFPKNPPEPVHPRDAEAIAAAAFDDIHSPGRAKTAKQRRNEAWIS